MKTESGRVLPKGLANKYATDEKRYTGAFSELHFDGLDIEANALFSVFSDDRKLIARSKTRYHRDIVKYDGSVNNDRNSIGGYRAQIVGDMANAGLIISDEILDSVFKQMEDELVAVHKKVFPEKQEEAEKDENAQAADEEGKTVFIEGEIKTSEQTTIGHFDEPVTLYTLDVGGQVKRRIGVRGHCDLLAPGDLIRAELMGEEVVARRIRTEYLQIPPTEVRVVDNKIEYLKMVGWKRLDSATSQEGEKSEEEKQI